MPSEVCGCYRVLQISGNWAVHFDSSGDDAGFPTQQAAIDAARSMARTRWSVYGLPSCVQIAYPDGTIVDDLAFPAK